MKKQDNELLEHIKQTSLKPTLTFALSEWAIEKLSNQEVLDVDSLIA